MSAQEYDSIRRRLEAAERANKELEKQLQDTREAAEQERLRLEKELEKKVQEAKEAAEKELEKKVQEAKEAAEKELEKKDQKTNQLRQGTYYSSLNQVWGVEAKQYNIRAFDALKRNKSPNFDARSSKKPVYILTEQKGSQFRIIAADDQKNARTSLVSTTRDSIWPCDIFGNPPDVAAHVAHLVPASSDNATLYYNVALWAFGLEANAPWKKLQIAIHGAKYRGRGQRRLPHTGMKHFVSNKIRMYGQVEFYDQRPCVIIIPMMDLKDVKAWNGSGYKALVLVELWEGVSSLGSIYQGIRLTEKEKSKEEIATPQDIEMARTLLERVILGMAYGLHNRRIPRQLRRRARDTLEGLRRQFTPVTGGGVIVPKSIAIAERGANPSETEENPFRVRVVKFSEHDATSGHPAPDPLLLAVKAAINWSWQKGQKLFVAGEPPELEDELDILAEEQYLEWRNNLHRPQDWKDLAIGLRQLSGYQGDDGANA